MADERECVLVTKKAIFITTRWPRNRSERSCYGDTHAKGQIADIFINRRENRKVADFIDTLYHEFTHAVFGLYVGGTKGRQEERICRTIGDAASKAFKNG